MGNQQRTHRRLVGFLIEDTPGTYETDLDANSSILSSNAANFFSIARPTFTQNPQRFERQIHLASLGRPKMYAPGVSIAEVSFTVEMAGHASNAQPLGADMVTPPIGRMLQCCGLAQQAVNFVTLSSWTTGASIEFEHGEQVTGSSTFDGTAFGDTNQSGGNNEFWYEQDPSGAFATAGETLTGTDSGAIAVAGAQTPSAYDYLGWKLDSDWPQPTSSANRCRSASIILMVDGRYVTLRGCVGTASMNFNVLQPSTITFTFWGILNSKGARAIPEGYGSSGSPTIQTYEPAPFLATELNVDPTPGGSGTAVQPAFSTLTFDLGNNVVMHSDAQQSEGYLHAMIDGRVPTVTVDMDLGKDQQEWEAAFESSTEFHLDWLSAADTSANRSNLFGFRLPGMEIASRSEGDRDDITNQGTTFTATVGKGASGHYGLESEYTIFGR